MELKIECGHKSKPITATTTTTKNYEYRDYITLNILILDILIARACMHVLRRSALICVSSLLLQIAMRLCRIGKNYAHGICTRKRNKRKEFVFNGYTVLSVRFMTKNRLKGRHSQSRPLKCVFYVIFIFILLNNRFLATFTKKYLEYFLFSFETVAFLLNSKYLFKKKSKLLFSYFRL